MATGLPLTIPGTLSALALPPECRVDQRVPKKLLLEHGAPTSADKRLIKEAVEEIHWLAALKPSVIGVQAYQDELREYLEIAVLGLTLRGLESKPAQALRLAERLHRAVPYPLLLIVQNGVELLVTLAHKRWAQNEAGKVVLEDELTTVTLVSEADPPQVLEAFIHSLALTRQPQRHLKASYQGWIDACDALHASRRTGVYRLPANPEEAAARRAALLEFEKLEAEIERARNQAKKEKQLARQVELNLAVKALKDQLVKMALKL